MWFPRCRNAAIGVCYRQIQHTLPGSLQEGTMLSTSTANALYASSCRAGWVGQIWAKLRGQSRRLLDLTAIVAAGAIGDRHAAGTQTVPIRQIGGSEGRCDDFDVAFHPLKTHTAARWVSVASAYMC